MQESAERARYMQHLHLEAATMQEHIRQQEQLLKVQQTRVLEMKQQLDDMRAAQSKLKPLSLRCVTKKGRGRCNSKPATMWRNHL